MPGANKYKVLIVKYLQSEATPEEQKLVEDYIARSEKNKQLFESYRGLMFLTQKKKIEYNTDKAWERVLNRIQLLEQESSGKNIIVKKSITQLPVFKFAMSAVAAVLIALIGVVSVMDNDGPGLKQYSSGLAVAAPAELPDGTSVILNSKSTLKFPEKFGKDVREVSIFGEAFFEVTPDPDKPFIIHANGMDIKVLGTSFNIEAYPSDDYVKVTVNTGKVEVYPSDSPEGNNKDKHYLTAGEIATYSHKTGVIFKSVNDDLNVLSWKTGVLTFKEARLAEVFKAFEEKYQKQFVIDDSTVLNQRLTARFENESLDDALETLSLIFNINFEIKERYIIVH